MNEQEQEEGEEEGQVFDVIITKIKPPGDDDADQQKGKTYGLLFVWFLSLNPFQYLSSVW